MSVALVLLRSSVAGPLPLAMVTIAPLGSAPAAPSCTVPAVTFTAPAKALPLLPRISRPEAFWVMLAIWPEARRPSSSTLPAPATVRLWLPVIAPWRVSLVPALAAICVSAARTIAPAKVLLPV